MMAYGQYEHIDSFYHLKTANIKDLYCRCLACFVARNLDHQRYQKALRQKEIVYHLGRAFKAPEAGFDQERPAMAIKASEGIVLNRLIHGGAKKLVDYLSSGGYCALKKALSMTSDQVVFEVGQSGLRGRGGAGFDTGKKWRAVYNQASPKKFIVANGDEGDPGAYIDRFILEEDPFSVIEAVTIAGYALGAQQGFIYIRKEYEEGQKAISAALQEARDAKLLGRNISGSTFNFDLAMIGGHGSYLCGEETALLNALEGKRPEVRARPPYPSENGLFNAPTLVNNIETLANIPWIINNGGAAFHDLGYGKSRGTKCISLNSLFKRPGLYEIDFGIPMRTIVEDIGGGLQNGDLKGVIVGGPLAGVIPPHLLDTLFGFEELNAIGASVGHGGVIAFDQQISIAELIHHVLEFGAFESCGKCTPCRVGSHDIELHFRRVVAQNEKAKNSYEKINRILDALKNTSLCAHGSGLADFVLSIQRYYSKEYQACFT